MAAAIMESQTTDLATTDLVILSEQKQQTERPPCEARRFPCHNAGILPPDREPIRQPLPSVHIVGI